MSPRRVRTLTGAGLLVLATLMGACGIPTDDQARSIPQDAMPQSLRAQPAGTSTTISQSTAQRENIYLVQTSTSPDGGGEQLKAVPFDLPNPQDPETLPRLVIEKLISTRPEEIGESSLTNPVPKDTRVLNASVGSDGVLDLDLSSNFSAAVEGPLLRLAVAQIVFTATDLTALNLKSVRLSLDGQPVPVPVEEGTAEAGRPVSPADFPRFQAQLAASSASPGAG